MQDVNAVDILYLPRRLAFLLNFSNLMQMHAGQGVRVEIAYVFLINTMVSMIKTQCLCTYLLAKTPYYITVICLSVDFLSPWYCQQVTEHSAFSVFKKLQF